MVRSSAATSDDNLPTTVVYNDAILFDYSFRKSHYIYLAFSSLLYRLSETKMLLRVRAVKLPTVGVSAYTAMDLHLRVEK